MSPLAFTDSAHAHAAAGCEYGYDADHADADRAQDCAIAEFAPYDVPQLRRALSRFLTVAAGGSVAAALPTLPEPGLYALAAALAHPDLAGVARPDNLAAALRSEIRCRTGQGMGSDPSGPVRRGRLLQHIGIFTTLAVPGASPLQRRKLLGGCPFCRAPAAFPASFQVSLPAVCWQCFACGRRGGLPEFAECLLTDGATVITTPTPAGSAGAGSAG